MKLSEALREAFRSPQKTIGFTHHEGPRERLGFPEFARLVEHTLTGLRALGVGPGCAVAVLGPTCLELARCCAAVWMAGATLTVLPTPTRMGQRELYREQTLEKLRRCEASLLLGEPSLLQDLVPRLSHPAVAWDALELIPGWLAALPGRLPQDVALIQFSSGTTNDPRPIMLSAGALLANAKAVLDSFPGSASEHSCVSWLPLYHDMGLIGCFLMPILAPGNLTLLPPEVFATRPHRWLEAISEQRATTSSAPNFAFAHCCDRISAEKMEGLDLSCWQIAMVGAEAVRPQTLRRFAAKFSPVGFQAKAFSPVYGLAEATLAVTFSALGEGLKVAQIDSQGLASTGLVSPGDRESVSVGKPLPGLKLEIRDEKGLVLPEGRLGGVWVKGPSLLSGVLGESSPVLDQGWLDTGDLGFLRQGELHVYGRRRDILLLDGRNHDPQLVESAAQEATALQRSCAFTFEPAGASRDRLALVGEVSRRWRGELNELVEQIKSACRRGAGLVPQVVAITRAGQLPLTSSGKLRRAEAARMFAAGEIPLLETSDVPRSV